MRMTADDMTTEISYSRHETDPPTRVTSASSTNQDPRNRCCWNGRYFCDAIKAMVTRQLFLFHALLAVWQVTLVTSTIFWCLSLTFIGMVVETLVVLIRRRGSEWSWFQWSVFLYLLGVVPPIWILELHKMGRWQQIVNSTLLHNPLSYQIIEIEGLRPFQMKPEDWVVALEQTLLVIIIIGRWLMPKGDLTRDQLSSLLLVHLGTASDIVDFLTLLAEEEILKTENNGFVYAILVMWSWSLLQFPFVVTAKKAKADITDAEVEEDVLPTRLSKLRKKLRDGMRHIHDFLETEAWAIFVSMLMQDGPFVIMRITAIVKYRVVTYTNYFFACKNALVLLLQLYRLLSIYHEHKVAKREAAKKAKSKRLSNKIWDEEAIARVQAMMPSPYRKKRKAEILASTNFLHLHDLSKIQHVTSH